MLLPERASAYQLELVQSRSRIRVSRALWLDLVSAYPVELVRLRSRTAVLPLRRLDLASVTSITGTTNQVVASAASGGVTLSLPQSINTGANVQFNSLGIGTAASATAGEIRATNNVTAYYSSDERLKTNIEKIDGALEKISQIDGVIYDWNETYLKDHGNVDGYFVRERNSGVIAQQVEKVFPNVVADRADGYKAVRYELLVPLLIEAIKELKEQIAELKK
jgi:hypothetical protein